MPSVINGFEVLTKPKDTQAESFPVFIQVPAGTTRTISFPTEFNGIAISVAIINRDAANAGSFQVNTTSGTAINLPASSRENFNDMNIITVQATAGAAGVIDIFAQVTPNPIYLEQRTAGSLEGRL